jgi:lysophospholipase L1-like esterase
MSINVNNDGFRGPEIKLEKPDNTYRIFAVGGSTTMGHAATSDKATWPAFLEKKFNDENLGINVEVINAGINGAYSFSETYHIRDNILKFDPDLIINYGGVNDADRWIENPQIKTTDEVNEEYEGFKFKNYPFYRTPFMIFSLFFAEDLGNEIIAEEIFKLALPIVRDGIQQ